MPRSVELTPPCPLLRVGLVYVVSRRSTICVWSAAYREQLPGNAHFQDEKDVKACLECGHAFNSITRRKHHCRICGRVVCWFCSMHTLHDPANPTASKVRACNSCYTAAATHSLSASPATTARSLSHSHSTSLSSPSDDPHSLSRSHPDSTSSFLSTSSTSINDLSAPLVTSPLHDPLQPLPMPIFSSPDAVDNTVAAVTTILLEEQRKHDHLGDQPVHVTANTHSTTRLARTQRRHQRCHARHGGSRLAWWVRRQ